MSRSFRGMLMWGLLGAAAGAYFMARTDYRTRQRWRNQARRLTGSMRRWSNRTLHLPEVNLGHVVRAGRNAIGSTVKSMMKR